MIMTDFVFLNNILKWSKNYIGKRCYDDNIISILIVSEMILPLTDHGIEIDY